MTDAFTDEIVAEFQPEAERMTFPVSRLVVDPERFPNDAREPMATRGMGAVYERLSTGEPLRVLDYEKRSRLMRAYYSIRTTRGWSARSRACWHGTAAA
jgi:hypothetical protein